MRKLNFLAILLIIMLMVSACGGGEDETATRVTNEPAANTTTTEEPETAAPEPEMKASYKERTIQVGTMHYPPFEIVDNGAYKGPGMEVLMAALDYLGYDYVVKDYPWARMLDSMETGELDMMIDAYITPERQGFMYYSQIPYGTFPQALYALKDSNISFDGDLNSLKDYTVGVTRGYSYGTNFDTAMNNQVFTSDESDTVQSLFEKLAGGRVDLAADTYYSGQATLPEMGLEDKVVLVEPFFDSLYSYVVFSKANDLEPLRDEYDDALRALIANGTMKEIFDKYEMGDILEIMLEDVE